MFTLNNVGYIIGGANNHKILRFNPDGSGWEETEFSLPLSIEDPYDAVAIPYYYHQN